MIIGLLNLKPGDTFPGFLFLNDFVVIASNIIGNNFLIYENLIKKNPVIYLLQYNTLRILFLTLLVKRDIL